MKKQKKRDGMLGAMFDFFDALALGEILGSILAFLFED